MDDLPDVADGAGAEGARGGRAAKRSNYMAVNHIEWKDVAPGSWVATVVEPGVAKFLNPGLREVAEEDLTEEDRTFFVVHKRPEGAVVKKWRNYDTEDPSAKPIPLADAKAAPLFHMPAEVLNAFVNGGLNASIAGARKPASVDSLEWQRNLLLVQVAIAAHRAAQDYTVGKEVGEADNSPFDNEQIETANKWLEGAMGKLPDWVMFDEHKVF